MLDTPKNIAIALGVALAQHSAELKGAIMALPTEEQFTRMQAHIADMQENGYIFTPELVNTMAQGLTDYDVMDIPGYDGECGLNELLNTIFDKECK